jgi:hypothetical protein
MKLGTGALSDLLAEQPSERVLQMPLAPMKLYLRPALLDRLDHPAMRIANHARRLAFERGEKGAPVSGMGGGEGLGTPEPGLAGAVADRTEDVEGDRPSGDAATACILGPDPEWDLVQEQRAVSWPRGRSVRCKDDGCEELDPVGDELAVGGLADLASR